MKHLFTILFFTLLSTAFQPVFGQANIGPAGMHAQVNIDQVSGPVFGTIRPFDNRYKGFKGIPTIYEEFVPGKVLMKDGKVYDNALFNYDVFNNEVYYRYQTNRQVVVVDNEKIEKLILSPTENEEVVFVPIELEDKGLLLMEVLAANEEKIFLKRHKKIIMKASYQEAYSAGKEHDEFKDRQEFYYQSGNVFHAIKPNAKALSKTFPDQSKIINDTIKSRKLDLKDEKDLKNLLLILLRTIE
jgi:hypothetical protein